MNTLNGAQLNLTELNEMIEQGYVTQRPHPTDDLYILNYSHTVQVEQKWNPTTMMCRGLIVDGDYNIIKRPFPKFFSLDQWRSIRNHVHHCLGLKFKDMFQGEQVIFDKMDGSMGIIYESSRGLEVATRGSFESDQAKRGTEILNRMIEKDSSVEYVLSERGYDYTHIVEIIYPENRIVVDYKGEEKLVLLGEIETATGAEQRHYATGVSLLMEYTKPLEVSFNEATHITNNPENEEGYVIYFPQTGIRVKHKFEEYKRLHKIMTEVTPLRIWDVLRNGQDVNKWLEGVPDEFYDEVMVEVNDFRAQYARLEDGLKDIYDKHKYLTRKEIGQNIHLTRFSKAYIFARLDGKDESIKELIWKRLRPNVARDNC